MEKQPQHFKLIELKALARDKSWKSSTKVKGKVFRKTWLYIIKSYCCECLMHPGSLEKIKANLKAVQNIDSHFN